MNFKNNFLKLFLVLTLLTPVSLLAQELPDPNEPSVPIEDPGTELKTQADIQTAATKNAPGDGINYIAQDLKFTGQVNLTNENFLLRSKLDNTETAKQFQISGEDATRLFNITVSSTTMSNMKFIKGSADSETQGSNKVAEGGAVKIVVSENPKDPKNPNQIVFDQMDFSENKADISDTGNVLSRGGAISINSTQSTLIMNSTFTANTVTAASTDGGSADGSGGAIYATGDGQVDIFNTYFSENEAQNGGGAIVNATAINTMNVTSSVFEKNKANLGGAIITFGKLKIEDTLFEANEATASGGAMYLFSNSETQLNKATFKENTAANEGGALYNEGASLDIQNSHFNQNKANLGGAVYSITDLNIANYVHFSGNEALAGDGGAIYNTGKMKVGASTFTGNKATGNGGAIFTSNSAGEGNIHFTGGVFNDNHSDGLGGAIYADNVTLTINSIVDSSFKGNTDSTGNNAIYLNNATLNLNPTTGSISFYDKIAGTGGSTLNINATNAENPEIPAGLNSSGTINFYETQDTFLGTINSYGGTLGIYGDISFAGASSFNMGNTHLAMQNHAINSVDLGNFTSTGDNYASIDVDPLRNQIDTINSTSGTGDIYVTDVRVLSDSAVVDIAFNVSNNLNIIFDPNKKYYGPIFLYMMNSIDGQNANLHRTNELTPSVLGATITQNAIYSNNMLIANSLLDRVGVMLSTDGRYYGSTNNYSLSRNDNFSNRGSFKTADLTQKDFYTTWFVPYASNQKMDLDYNLSGVKNNAYGANAGVDLPVMTLGDFGFIPTFFAGYGGGTQKYKELKIQEDSLLVGAMATLYHSYFYSTLEMHITNGSVVSELDNGDRDNFDAFSYTVASRTEFTLPLGEFVEFRPSVFLAYNFTTSQNYETGLGASIKADNKNTFQVAPEAKLIADIKGWHPYLNFSYTFGAYDDHTVQANDFVLPEFGVKDYYKYGIGIENTFLENYSGYAQVSGYGKGLKGYSVQVGLRGYIE